jgi:cytidylate kinase
LAAEQGGVSFDDEAALTKLAAGLQVEFRPGESGEPASVFLEGVDVSRQVRAETTGYLASQVAIYTGVRNALLSLQQSFAKAPGLVADGRDMGTIVFTQAPTKIYLTASAEARANRRFKQLKEAGQSVNLAALLQDIQDRDERDMNREIAPLKPADDAVVIDSSKMAIGEVFKQVINLINKPV